MKALITWAGAAGAVTAVLLVSYVLVQQDYREGLNDPQIAMAEDAAARLGAGGVPADIVPHGTPLVDIGASLSPWIAVYDQNGTVLESSGQLNGAPPRLPSGVFDTSRWLKHPNGLFFNQSPVLQDRFTWQPEQGVRVAVILTKTADGKYYVAAGRNMREVEQRIEHEGELAGLGWIVTLIALSVVQWLYVFIDRRAARGGARRS